VIRLAAFLLLFARCMAESQSVEPSVRGRVTGPAGRPVPNATVSLKNATGNALLSITAANGTYTFRALMPGIDYELKADNEGMASPVRSLRVSAPDEIVTIDLTVTARILFEDVTQKTGIDFTLRNGRTGRFYLPEIMLGGVAALDFNGDGCIDIFVTNGASLPEQAKTANQYSNRLYRNNCDMTFTDVTEKAWLAGSGYAMGAAAGDFDNDGFVDLFVTGLRKNTLYRNRGDGTFEDITAKAGLDRKTGVWSVSAGWFDYDNDGYLDLFVTHYLAWTLDSDGACKLSGKPFYCHPRDFKGLPNQLFHNNRDGTFTDVSASSGVGSSIGKGMGVAFGDFNGDGLADVFVTNDSIPNFLFQNLGNGKFKEVALEKGVAFAANGNAVAGMGADFRDFDNDGLDDIALDAMYWDEFPLFRNRGKPNFFTDETIPSGIALATRNLTGWGMGMYDFDNDGHKDLFFAVSHFPGSEPQVHADQAMANHVLRNLGGGSFEDVSSLAGRDFQQRALYHGAAFADLDNDGRVDVVVSAVNGPLKIFRNSSPAGHWVALRLVGTKGNREGLGARVRVTLPTGNVMYNHATTSVGYASSSEPLVRFGMGPYDYAPEIEIRWPGGQAQTLKNTKADQVLTVREP
jgi:enediyne biosynthesis protein E4